MDLRKRQKSFEILYLSIMTILGILCVCVALASHWGSGIIVMCVFSVVVGWASYIFDVADVETRRIMYTVFADIVLILYGKGTLCFSDVPILICLFMTVAAFGEDLTLQHILIVVYPILTIYHFAFTGYISKGMGMLAVSRLILGAFCIACTYIVAKYITAKEKGYAEELCKLVEKLQLAEKENEQFMANVSHQLRTPINAVNGESQILLQKKLDPEIRKPMNAIYDAGRRLNSQISDILDYAEIITDDLVCSETNYEIATIINDMASNFIGGTDNNIEYVIDVDPDIPSVLHGDAAKIRKIMTALVDNSFKFTKSGGIFLKIGKTDESYGINLIIDVFDTGIGMSEEVISNIYNSFDRTENNASFKNYGLGLGLKIVYGFAKSMGGTMVIESVPNSNTHIRVSIPQRVISARPSIALANADKYTVAAYLNFEKFTRLEIGRFYLDMIKNIQNKLGLNITNAGSLEELKMYLAQKSYSHVVVSKWEYDMDPDYFENLADSVFVLVFVDSNFIMPSGSKIISIKKPLYIQAIINVFRQTTPGSLRIVLDDADVSFEGIKALVVDDDNMNLTVAKGMLGNYGVSVTTASSGSDAIDKCMIEDYDVIFMDIMMPQMDGIECMNRIRRIRKSENVSSPIIAVTANTSSGAREKYIQEGFDDYIEKPIEISALIRVLKKYDRRGGF